MGEVIGAVVGPTEATTAAAPRGALLDLDEAWRLHRPSLVALAALLCGNRADAEDVVQDVFAAVGRKPRHVENVEGYLRAAVVNRSRRVGRRRITIDEADPALVGVGDEYDTTLACVLALRPRYRAAVVLRFYDDLSMADIAHALGCREATARSLVRRGLAMLKETIDED